uniref:Alpha-galactosidase n=1 Tax=Saccharomyces arboricola TaxID=706196 RepID=A0A160VJ63_9SACH|nr:melibiase (alpha-galactosidase) [Saccharomyces arboricola]CUW00887.1 melibiase (alpha-galactosidase) [Saccharomyces arboricola]
MSLLHLFISLTAVNSVLASSPSYNGLGLTPQMGWDNWNTFACDVSEDLLLGTANRISDIGLKDLGYKYVILDDCWSSGRTSNGTLVADENKFPNGMGHVAENLHNNNFLFGMYSSAGEYTCAGYPGSLGHEEEDAEFFANNDVDYLKYDNCYNKGQFGAPETSYQRYKAMSDALNKTGRPIFYSLCNWGQDLTFYWGSGIANSWRISGDIYAQFSRPDSRCPCDGDQYDCPYAGFHCSIMNILNKAAPMGQNAGIGGWNDLDNLEVGVGNLTDDEEKAHFSMWAMVKSPLIIGADVNQLKASSFSIYSQASIIAINQDPKGTPATRVWRYYVPQTDKYGQGEIQLWSGPLDNGDQVIALLNGGNKARPMNASLEQVFFDSYSGSEELSSKWDIYDLWANRVNNATSYKILQDGRVTNSSALYNATELSYKDGLSKNDTRLFGTKIGTISPGGLINTTVPAHGIAFYRLRRSSK